MENIREPKTNRAPENISTEKKDKMDKEKKRMKKAKRKQAE